MSSGGPTESSQALTVPSSSTVLSVRHPAELSVEEHEEILVRARRVGRMTTVLAMGVGGSVGVLAPPAAAFACIAAMFIVGRLLRHARVMPYQRVLAEYGIDAAGEAILLKAWRKVPSKMRRQSTTFAAGTLAALLPAAAALASPRSSSPTEATE